MQTRRRSAGLAPPKTEIVLRMIQDHGVHAYQGSTRYVRAALGAGSRSAAVSSDVSQADALREHGVGLLVSDRAELPEAT